MTTATATKVLCSYPVGDRWCRNKAKYGPHCTMHFQSHTGPWSESGLYDWMFVPTPYFKVPAKGV